MNALTACWDCDFVARADSAIGATGEWRVPYCRHELTPVTISAAEALQIRSRERLRMGAPPPSPPACDSIERIS
jgi:hypothetical protein